MPEGLGGPPPEEQNVGERASDVVQSRQFVPERYLDLPDVERQAAIHSLQTEFTRQLNRWTEARERPRFARQLPELAQKLGRMIMQFYRLSER